MQQISSAQNNPGVRPLWKKIGLQAILRFVLFLLIMPLLLFADKCSFPEAGGSRDEDHAWRAVHGLVQPLDQAGAEDNFRSGWGDIKFRG